MNYDKELLLRCSCGGCGILALDYDDHDKNYEFIYVTYYSNAWYERGNHWRKIFESLKMMWFILIGKEYRMFDIVLDKESTEELKDFMAGLEE